MYVKVMALKSEWLFGPAKCIIVYNYAWKEMSLDVDTRLCYTPHFSERKPDEKAHEGGERTEIWARLVTFRTEHGEESTRSMLVDAPIFLLNEQGDTIEAYAVEAPQL